MRKYLLSIFAVFILGNFCYSQKADIDEWSADLDFYHKTLEERHIDLYHLISKDEFALEIKKIKEQLPQLNHFQVTLELMRLTHKVGGGKGDGHTAVPLWGMKLHKYPINLFDFGDELRILKVKEEYHHLLGKKLTQIDGTPIAEIYNKVTQLTPFTENHQSSMDRTCSSLIISEVLFGLNIVKQKDEATFTFVDAEGNYESIILEAKTKEENEEFEYKTLDFQYPNLVRPDSSKMKNLWYTSLKDSLTVYVSFKEYPSEKEMNEFAEELLDNIQKNNSQNLVIDIRDNYGGDFFMGLILASWLNVADCIDWMSGVYVLTNRVTYSAAMVNALQFREQLNAKIIGEPTGANPNGYQDLGQFNLPNSNVLITYTKRLFRLQDVNTEGVQPDVLIIPKWDKYEKGIDEVLEWVIKDIDQKQHLTKNKRH